MLIKTWTGWILLLGFSTLCWFAVGWGLSTLWNAVLKVGGA